MTLLRPSRRALAPALLVLLVSGPVRAGEPFRTVLLDNGLTLLFAPTDVHPVIAASCFVTTGGRTEDEYFQGSLHYIEHLVFKGGTPNLPPTEYRKMMSRLGRESGGWTWDDEINFGFEVPAENFPRALEVLREALLDLRFEEEWFEDEKEVVLQEMTRGLEQPRNVIHTIWDQLAFQVHPYRRDVIGTEKAIRELDMKATEKYYRERFTPNHMILSIAGDFEPDAMVETVREVWGGLGPGPESFELGLVEPEQTGPRTRADHLLQATDARLLVGVVTPGGSHEDTPALTLLAELMEDRSYGLPQYLVEQEKWVTSVSVDHYPMRDYGAFRVSARMDPAKERAVERFVSAFLVDFDVRRIPGEIFEEKLRALLFAEAEKRDSAADRAHRFGFLVSRLGREEALALLDRYEALTPERVQAAKERWIGPRRLVTATLLPEDFDPIASVAGSVEPGAPFAPEPPDLDVAGALRPAEAEPLAYEKTDEADGVSLYTFANGLRLLVRPASGSPLVAVTGRVLGGQWVEPPERAGINRFVAELGLRSTRRWSPEGFTRLLGSRSIRATPHAPSRSRANTSRNVDYRDAGAHHYVALREQWPATLACLKESLFFPEFDPDQVEKLRADLLTEIRSLPENNLEYIKQEFYVAAYPGHPYGRPTVGTEESVGAITAEDLHEFHREHWTPDRTVVSVVGDVDPAGVAEWIASRWADLPDREVSGPWMVDATRPRSEWPPPAGRLVLALGKDYWTVNWGRPGCAYADEKFFPSVVLGRIAGSDHFYKYVYGEGVSYRSWIRFWENLGAGTWILENDVKRDRFDQIMAMFDEDLARYSTVGFDEKQFEDGVQRLVNARILDDQDGALLAWRLAVAEGNGAGFRRHTRAVDNLRAVTFDQIQELAKEVFDPEGMLRIVQQ